MNMWKLAAGAALASAMALQAAHAGDYATYTVDAYDTSTINLHLCTNARVVVRGDGDTDLDFAIYGPSGQLVHVDRDSTDLTFADIYRGRSGCADYTLYIENLGDVYNRYSVALIDA